MCWLSWVWPGSHFGCDYTDYYILVAAEWCKSLLYFLFCWGCTGGCEGAQLGQLIPTDQKDIPYSLISCSAIKLPGFLSKDSLPRWSGHCSAYEIVWVNPFYSAFFPLLFFPSPSLSSSIRVFFCFFSSNSPPVLLQGGDRGSEQANGRCSAAGWGQPLALQTKSCFVCSVSLSSSPNQSQPLTGPFMHEGATEAEVKCYSRGFQIWWIKLPKYQ